MKRLYWKYRYARHLKARLGLTLLECWSNAESALGNVGNDLSECPIYSAEEKYYAWADASK